MQVLILHQFFNTPEKGGPLRSYYLATALKQAGFTVHVVTTHNLSNYQRADVDGLDVHYLPVTYDNRYGFFRRIYSFLRFVGSIVRQASQFRDVTLCYAISAPLTTGLAAMALKWRYGIPYVFEVGDLWPEAPVQLGIIRNTLLKQALYRLEAAIYRRSLSVVALSAAIASNIQYRFPHLTVHVLPNMADTDFYHPGTDPELKKKYGVQNSMVVSYVGTMGLANGLTFLLDCAEACLRNNLPVNFLLCGDGAKREALQLIAKRRKLENVHFLPFQNREGVSEVFRITDVAMICFQPLPVLETGSPNKYFDALAAGKAVVLNFGGWLKQEIEQNGCGFFAASADSFVKQIQAYLQDEALLKQAQQAARQLAFKYARTALSEKFVHLLQEANRLNTKVRPVG